MHDRLKQLDYYAQVSPTMQEVFLQVSQHAVPRQSDVPVRVSWVRIVLPGTRTGTDKRP